EPWPEKADGDGYSLITKEPNPGRDENDARWWRISAAIHGSPGRDDPNSTVVEKTAKLPPARFQLQQNYPNPFNPRTAIFYSIPYNAFVTLTVYDVLGREIKTLVKSFQKANDYTVSFDASQLPSGIYFYRLKAGAKFQKTRKMLLVR
ncbi:T9SS type A sorting domain-containing protein, partial [candidate division KSB1 bacterium]|nr:T9SS type A sorting domain-containing protein [candidate division KSB1 bacterium]